MLTVSRILKTVVFSLAVAVALGLGVSAIASTPRSKPEPVRVLIFSEEFGAGHDAAANRIAETLTEHYRSQGIDVEIIQKHMLDFSPEWSAKRALKTFSQLQSEYQKVYSASFDLYLLQAELVSHAGQMTLTQSLGIDVAKMERFMLEAFTDKNGKAVLPTAVYSTWPGSTEALISLKHKHGLHYVGEDGVAKRLKFAHVQTDHGTERYFYLMARDADVALLPSAEVFESYKNRGLTNIVFTGMPLRLDGKDLPSFEENELRKKEARKALNLDPDKRTVMIEAGKNGAANYTGIIAAVLKANPGQPMNFIASCGKNDEAKELVEIFARGAKRGTPEFDRLYSAMEEIVRPWSWKALPQKGFDLFKLRRVMTKRELIRLIESGPPSNVQVLAQGWGDINPLRAAADLVVTKPGGLSTAELAANGRAMMIMQQYASGEARPNGPLFEKKGLAIVNPDLTLVGPQTAYLFAHPEIFRQMYEAAPEYRKQFNLKRAIPFVDESYADREGRTPSDAHASFCGGLFQH